MEQKYRALGSVMEMLITFSNLPNYLLMQKIFQLLILFLSVQNLSAQTDSSPKLVEYGIMMGAHLGHLKTDLSDWESAGISNELRSLETQNRVGFSLGILAKIRISQLFSIVPQANLTFLDGRLNYDLESQNDHQESLEAVLVEFPLHFVFTHSKYKRVNPSIFFGGRYAYDLRDAEDTDFKLQLKKHDFMLDLGTGLEIKLKRFKVKPELMYSLGLANLKDSGEAFFNSAIEGIYRDRIALRVSFYN